jgi:hypothetical protein
LKNQKEEEEEEFSGDGDFVGDDRKRRRRVQACRMSSAREACNCCPSVKRVQNEGLSTTSTWQSRNFLTWQQGGYPLGHSQP